MTGFFSRLEERVAGTGSLLCVGLDPRVESARDAREQCLGLIEATARHAAAFKPNSAFFEAHGPAGMEALVEVVAAVPDEIPVLLDAKRGDIGSTTAAYATAAFEVIGAGAVTVSPYLGRDAVEPFLDHGDVFVLCQTSNPGAAMPQNLVLAGGQPLYLEVARMAAGWAGPDRLGLVVGATRPQALSTARAAAPEHWILAPGVGAQGASLEEALPAGLRPDGTGVLVPVSRAIADSTDPSTAAADLAARISAVREKPSQPRRRQSLGTALFDAGCIRLGEFELKSGVVSPIYLDLRTLSGHPELLRHVAGTYRFRLGGSDRIAAVPLAGLPLATAVSLASGLPLVYPRPPKGHGTGATVEGPFAEGDRVTIVDDVATSGGSILEAADRLEAAGLRVVKAVVLVDRRGGAAEALARRGIQLDAVLDLVELVEELAEESRITRDDLVRVREFLGA